MIETEIEDNQNMKVLRSKLSKGRNRITCIKDSAGKPQYENKDILEAVRKFYADLYEN